MATKVQRMCLWHMMATTQPVLIFTGHKSTTCGRIANGRFLAITCSECVLLGLLSKEFIEKDNDSSHEYAQNAYRITSKGIKAAGKHEPIMRVKSQGARGIRWA